MANLNYSDLGLKRDIGINIFAYNGKQIEVYKYLPIESKYDVVMITLQEAFEDGIYNPIKLDMHFHLNLVYMYTNLVFTQEEKENEDKLYDEMKSTGFMDKFLQCVNPDEYKEMQEDIENIAEMNMTYKSTTASVLRNFIEDLPANAEAASKIIENFDPEKYQAVVDFAKAANNGNLPPA